jgi:DNA-binding NarL/FixJ family response regulator
VSGRRPPKPTLLIVDHPVTRLGVRIALQHTVSICAEADDAEGAISAAVREQPDSCLVGFGIPGGGLHAIRGMRRVAPKAAVIVLATTPDVDDLLSCIRAGAVGYLPSDVSPASLRRVLEAVISGEAAVSRSMVLALVRELHEATLSGDQLTARERQVLRMRRRGRSTAAIGDLLGISPVTVRRHISRARRKAGVEGRGELAGVDPAQPGDFRRGRTADGEGVMTGVAESTGSPSA